MFVRHLIATPSSQDEFFQWLFDPTIFGDIDHGSPIFP
jgi:hypothetical protein